MDEGTRNRLASLEQSIDRLECIGFGRRLLLLFGQEDYEDWSRHMRESIIPESMFCFIDGSLEDPDPGGVSGDEDVKKYSKKWKEFDKLVMEWIKDALHDILKKYMVEEMKTSKDMWETLEIFFSEEELGPLDSNSIPKLQNETNYNEWKENTESFLVNIKMGGFIDGTFRDPSNISRSIWQKYKAVAKKFSERWTFLDQRVMTLIKSSLSVELQDIVKVLKTSKEFWHALEILFTGYPDHIPVNEASFLSIKLFGTRYRLDSLGQSIDRLGWSMDSIRLERHIESIGFEHPFLLLFGQENYKDWSRQMRESIRPQSMFCFIDGSLEDPDPEGVSEDEDVVKYSKKWKKFDKLVMKWIKDALNDILNYMVEEMKTSKDMWETLEIFFSEEELGPLDSNSIPKLQNETNYNEWKEKTESFLVNKKMGVFIDGTFRDPSNISRNIWLLYKAVVKKFFERWTFLDQRVMTLIKSSLSVELQDIVKDLKTSKEFWHALEILFTGYPDHIPVNEASFLSIKLSGKENYIQWAQQIMCLLEMHGLQNLIDPLSRQPPASFGNMGWKEYDKRLKGWIFSSLAQNVIDTTLAKISTATELWGEIKNRYGPLDVEKTRLDDEHRTRLLLESLDTDKSVTDTPSIILDCEDNYQPWRDEMMEFLNSKRMKGFIDGTVVYRDPTGESEEDFLRRMYSPTGESEEDFLRLRRMYSEKWKRFDKQVMKWIMDSLNDILNYMVKEMKTSKDMWETLEIFFSEDPKALLPSLKDSHSHGEGVLKTLDIKLLDKDNYQPWRDNMMEFLDLWGMKGFIDGTFRDPAQGLTDGTFNLRYLYWSKEYHKWKRFDKQVMEWIMDSLTDIFKYMVQGMETSKEMWETLLEFFTRDTGALLASLNHSLSHGDGVRPTFDKKLRDKENYQLWRDEMMKFLGSQGKQQQQNPIPPGHGMDLDSKGMIGFIDGTLIDPDPKGESEDKDVRMYSEIWKRLDKQVMEWIRTSLDDIGILNYMVEKMKTSKELWGTLATFFSKEELGPLDSNSIPKLQNETNYNEWKEKTESFLVNKKMGGFIDGTFRDPSKISRSIRQQDKDLMKVYSEGWTLLDQRVMTLIKYSLSVILRDIVKDLKSSKEVWHALEILFTTGYPVHIPVIEANFLSIKLSGKENYIQWAQQIKDLLEMHGLQNLIDPLSRLPPATFENNHKGWKEYNQLLKGWIFSSLTQNVIDTTLTRIATATGLWGEIKNRYGPSDIEYTDLKGKYNHANYTALYKAIMSGDLEVTKSELVTHGYDVELSEDGPTPLHVIIVTRKQNHHYFEKVLDHVVSLIEKEALESTSTSTNPITLINLVNRDGRNTLHRAALVGNLHAAKRLVDKDPYMLFKEDNDKCLPIDVAISTPHKDTFRYLLIASKKNLSILDDKKITKSFGLIHPFEGKHGVRLLNAAIEAGYMEVAYQLIKMNADIAAENDGNSFRTPLYRIVENYDKYYSLPIRWKIFDQDVGMEFKATENGKALPRNQGTQNADIGDTWYSKARKAWMNLFKATLPVSAPATAAPAQAQAPAPAPAPTPPPPPVLALTTTPTPALASIVAQPISSPATAPALAPVPTPTSAVAAPVSTPVMAPGLAQTSAPTPAPASPVAQTSSIAKRTLGFLMFLLNWIVNPYKVLRYEPDRNDSLREDEVAHNKALLVVRTICNRLRLQSTILEKRLHYQSAATVAACKDQHEALKEIAEHFPEVMLMEDDGYNLMQLAVKYRSEKVFNFLAYETKVDTYFFKVKPKFGNSLLHYAGELAPTEKLDKVSGAALQMRKEVKWFKKVEKFALPGCDNEKNNMGETPMMVFRKAHADLKKRGEEWMKTVANSYIIVAALIITITFAALITVPGGSQQDSGDSPVCSPAGSPVASPVVNQNSIGLPVYIKCNLFMVFVFSNVTSFCGATTALVMFLSILTSRYTEEDFINKLPWKLAIGLLALIISLVGMLVAFGATLLLMLGHKDIFILVGIAFGIGLPVVTFIGFQVRMLWKIFR